MVVTHKINMDLYQRHNESVIDAVQGDSYTRAVEITMYDNNVPWTIPSGSSIRIRYGKPDGTGGYYDSMPDDTTAWSISGNVITIKMAPQMLTVPGNVDAQVEIINGDEILGTFSFIVAVDRDPAADTTESKDYIKPLEWMMEQIEEQTAQIVTGVADDAQSAREASQSARASSDMAALNAQAAEDSADRAEAAAEVLESVGAPSIDGLAAKLAAVYTWEKWDADPNVGVRQDAGDVTIATVSTDGGSSHVFHYADALALSPQDGTLQLADEKTISITANSTSSDLTQILQGCYARDGDALYYFPANVSIIGRPAGDGVIAFRATPVVLITNATRLGVVSSDTPYAYPNEGELDGAWYIASRQRGEEKVGENGASGVFHITLTEGADGSIIADKTGDEINDAYANKMAMYVSGEPMGNAIAGLSMYSHDGTNAFYGFTSLVETRNVYCQIWVTRDGNVNHIALRESEMGSGGADLTGYATEQWVEDGYQPKGDYAPASAIPTNAVQYVAQELTEEQKAQARENIGAADRAVVYGAELNITGNDLEVGGYVLANGYTTDDYIASGRWTDYIETTGYTHITFETKIGSAGAMVAFFDENKGRMPDANIIGTGAVETGTVEIPADAKYVRLSSYNYPNAWMTLHSDGLIKRVEALESESKKIMFFGDSITIQTNGYVSTVINETGWELVKNFAVSGAHWRNYNDTVLNGAPVSGSDPSNTMCNQVQKLLNESANYDVPDIVVFSAGTNDDYYDPTAIDAQFTAEITGSTYIDVDTCDLTTFAGAVRWCVEKVWSIYPDAAIFIASPIQGGQNVRPFYQTKSKADLLKELAERMSVFYINAFGESGIFGRYEAKDAGGKYLKDGLHPNAAGAEKLGKFYAVELMRHF